MKLSPIIFFTIIVNDPSSTHAVRLGIHISLSSNVDENSNGEFKGPLEEAMESQNTPREVPKDAIASTLWPFVGSPEEGCCISGKCFCPFDADEER